MGNRTCYLTFFINKLKSNLSNLQAQVERGLGIKVCRNNTLCVIKSYREVGVWAIGIFFQNFFIAIYF